MHVNPRGGGEWGREIEEEMIIKVTPNLLLKHASLWNEILVKIQLSPSFYDNSSIEFQISLHPNPSPLCSS
jgi:hypothetical protein